MPSAVELTKPEGSAPAFASALRLPDSRFGLGFRLGFAQAGNTVSFLPLTTLFEQLEALKPFEDISFAAQSGSRP